MAKMQVFTYDNLALYDTLLKGYVDKKDAEAIKTIAFEELTDGYKIKFYKVTEPVGSTSPAYEITIPKTDVSGLIAKITGATADNVVTAKADGTIQDSGVAIADLATKTEVEAVDNKVDTNTASIEAINDASTGILKKSQDYTDVSVASAVADVKSSLASALTYKGQKATESELPTTDNKCGDVWNVATTSKGTSAEYVWIITDESSGAGHWEELGTALDLSAYAEKTDVANDIATAKNEAVSTASADATTKANQALTDAKAYSDQLDTAMDARVDAIESVIGTGSSVDEKIANAKSEAIESAKTYSDGLNTAMDTRVASLETIVGEGVTEIPEASIRALFTT